MDGLKGAFDSFRVEEAYNWRDDIMEITRQIVHETDETRLNNIAEHFEVDLSEIRDFLEMKRKKMQKQKTNYDRIISKSVEELAKFMGELPCCPPGADVKELCYPMDACEGTDLQVQCWLDWLKQEADK